MWTAITLATGLENGDTIDGETLVTGERWLVKDQAAPAENGIYVVPASGAPTRATDNDTAADFEYGFVVAVIVGTAGANSLWQFTKAGTITLETTDIDFSAVAASVGATTFLGLTPIMLERSLQAQFLIPMAISLAFGVAFATLITLFLVPSLYMILEDIKHRVLTWVK